MGSGASGQYVARRRIESCASEILDDQPVETDFWQRVRWFAPGIMRLTAPTAAAGTSEQDALVNLNTHILTPETMTSSHYFFAGTRNYKTDDTALNDRIAEVREHNFGTEGKPMIELVQDRMGDAEFWSLKSMLLPIDQAPVRVRRKLKELIDREAAACAPGVDRSASQAAMVS